MTRNSERQTSNRSDNQDAFQSVFPIHSSPSRVLQSRLLSSLRRLYANATPHRSKTEPNTETHVPWADEPRKGARLLIWLNPVKFWIEPLGLYITGAKLLPGLPKCGVLVTLKASALNCTVNRSKYETRETRRKPNRSRTQATGLGFLYRVGIDSFRSLARKATWVLNYSLRRRGGRRSTHCIPQMPIGLWNKEAASNRCRRKSQG